MHLIRTFKWCEQYGIDRVEVILSDESATIVNSYKIKKLSHMIDVVKWMKCHNNIITQQSTFIMVAEWRVHNLLHWLKIEKDRTMHTDININNWKMKLAYAVGALFYIGQ